MAFDFDPLSISIFDPFLRNISGTCDRTTSIWSSNTLGREIDARICFDFVRSIRKDNRTVLRYGLCDIPRSSLKSQVAGKIFSRGHNRGNDNEDLGCSAWIHDHTLASFAACRIYNSWGNHIDSCIHGHVLHHCLGRSSFTTFEVWEVGKQGDGWLGESKLCKSVIY